MTYFKIKLQFKFRNNKNCPPVIEDFHTGLR